MKNTNTGVSCSDWICSRCGFSGEYSNGKCYSSECKGKTFLKKKEDKCNHNPIILDEETLTCKCGRYGLGIVEKKEEDLKRLNPLYKSPRYKG